MNEKPMRVLLVEDSAVQRLTMADQLRSHPSIAEVIEAADGRSALEACRKQRFDVVLLDYFLPDTSGLELYLSLYSTFHTPAVLVSLQVRQITAEARSLLAMNGDPKVLNKPLPHSGSSSKASLQWLVDCLRSATLEASVLMPLGPPPVDNTATKIVVIGTSLGGPATVAELLEQIPSNFTCPIMIVQHNLAESHDTYVSWLNHQVELKVEALEEHEPFRKGYVYVAPPHLAIEHIDAAGCRFRPEGHRDNERVIGSALHHCTQKYDKAAIGVLLSGLGADGAEALRNLRQVGGKTYVQDPRFCLAPQLPNTAIKLQAAQWILSAKAIGTQLSQEIQGASS